ncbi:MAG: sulfatase-like hydrolase/transferase [Alphaproteobacteria bacterium]|nr:sulfatase-like hydrolase/transferase [Alphaproteobacteria bacterium]
MTIGSWFAVLALAGCQRAETPSPAPLPDILLVVEDTVRADALGPYGAARPTAPQLTLIAEAGVLFEDVTAPGSWTWPSHASLFTGVYPWEHGAHFALPDDPESWSLSPTPFTVHMPRADLPTLAEQLAAAGYRTVSVSGNVLIGPDLPAMVRGFAASSTHADDDAVVARAIQEMDAEGPLFLFVNLFGAHGPLALQPAPWTLGLPETLTPEAAPAWAQPFLDGTGVDLHARPAPDMPFGPVAIASGQYPLPDEAWGLLRDLYDAEVLTVDRHLRDLVDAWGRRRPATGVVAVTSDHGEYFGERGLVEHGRTVYRPVLQVPLVIAAPGRIQGGTRVKIPVEMHQLHDTLLALAGLGGARSLLPLVGADPAKDPAVIRAAAWPDLYWARSGDARFTQGYRHYREGRWALVLGTSGGVELFDLAADPLMEADVAMQHPEVVSRLKAAAEHAFDVPEGASYTRPLDVEGDLTERLRALGYMGD